MNIFKGAIKIGAKGASMAIKEIIKDKWKEKKEGEKVLKKAEKATRKMTGN